MTITRDDLIDLLTRVGEVLEEYADVNDGGDGQPTSNRAMSLNHEVAAMTLSLSRGDHIKERSR